jgi:integrase
VNPSSPSTASPTSPTAASSTAAWKRGNNRRPFQVKGRSGWHAEYVYSDGKRQRRSFATEGEANTWLDDQKKLDNAATGPLLGGAERVTLGEFLGEYAFRHSIAKQSYDTEIARINHYVEAIGAPRLVVHHGKAGRRELRQEPTTAELPKAFKAHRDTRMALREKTYAWLGKLARKKVSQVTTADIRELMTTGKTEGWSDSTIQKEVALLKTAFNSAIREWRWKGFENPCIGLKLGKSNRRFVVVTDQQMQRLVQALSECDNPQVWPLVDLAIHTTLRQDSLLSMKWSQTNLETRRARVWAKGKWTDAQLPMRAVRIMEAMPRVDSDQVFDMSQNAVNMAWEGVREKAQLPDLTFRDLRHVGATAYAKAGLGAHALKDLLGHTTTRMAEVYVNLARSDVLEALDAVDAEMGTLTPVPVTAHAHGKQKHPRARKQTAGPASTETSTPQALPDQDQPDRNGRAKPVGTTNVFHLEAVKGRMRAKRAGAEGPGIDVGPVPARTRRVEQA